MANKFRIVRAPVLRGYHDPTPSNEIDEVMEVMERNWKLVPPIILNPPIVEVDPLIIHSRGEYILTFEREN